MRSTLTPGPILGLATTTTRLPVNERTALGLIGAWSAVRKISNAVGQMMATADTLAPDRRTILDAPPVVADPCVWYDPFDYWREITSHGLMRWNLDRPESRLRPRRLPAPGAPRPD